MRISDWSSDVCSSDLNFRLACDPGGWRTGAGGEDAEQRADLDGRALLSRDGLQGAVRGRVDLKRHLVGFQLDQRLVDADAVARLLQPLGNRRLGDRLAEDWHGDLECAARSEELTSELPSLMRILFAVFCL